MPAAPSPTPRPLLWQRVDWRAHQRRVLVAGREAHVVEAGEGPPLLLVHGLGGSWRNWLETIPAFVADHHVVAVDLPGFGASAMPEEPISIPGYGRFLDALLGALGLGPVAVVGSSMGGLICAELAIQFPTRVERLALVSSAGFTVEREGNDDALRLLRRLRRLVRLYVGAAALVAGRPEPFARHAALRRVLLRQTFAHPERLDPALAAEQLRGAGKPGFIDALESVMEYPIRDRLPAVACPTLVVWGASDRMIPVDHADEFERLIGGARKLVYPDTGHAPMLEQPARFNADLRAFLQERPGASASAQASATAQASASTSSGEVSHAHIQRTSPVRSSHV